MNESKRNRLDGCLAAIGWFHDGCNHTCSHRLSRVPWLVDLNNSLSEHYNSIKSYNSDATVRSEGRWTIKTTKVDCWKREIESLFDKWFFAEAFAVSNASCERLATYVKASLFDEFSTSLNVEMIDCHRVDASSDSVFYDLVYDELVFVCGTDIALLHLGFSD